MSDTKANTGEFMAEKPLLSSDIARRALRYDPETGCITRLAQSGPAKIGDDAGWIGPNGYRYLCLYGRTYLAHRIAFLLETGEWPKNHVDHINGVTSDNRWANLRDVTRTVNNQNERRRRGRGGKYGSLASMLGVCFDPRPGRVNPWSARITAHGKRISLGSFDTEEAAHASYVAAKRRHHDGCTI